MRDGGREKRLKSKDTLSEFERRKVVTGGGYGNYIFVIVSREISKRDNEFLSFILCVN